MGERIFIKAHNHPHPVSPISGVDYTVGMAYEEGWPSIPILWIALFSKNDITSVETLSHFWSGNDATTITVPTIHASTESALKRLRTRIPQIQRNTNGLLWPYVDRFMIAVEESGYDFLQLDLHILWAHTCDHDTEETITLIENKIGSFSSDSSWAADWGEFPIVKSSHLYGLNFPDMTRKPFDGHVDLPDLYIDTNGELDERLY